MQQGSQNNSQKISRRQAISIALLLLVSTSFGFVGGWVGSRADSGQLAGNPNRGQQIVIDEGELISNIASNVGESVVSISVTAQRTSDFFGFRQPGETESAGTGFILSREGVILTNRHVIPRQVDNIVVTLSDGTTLDDVEVIGRTNENDPLDIAFLRVRDTEGKELKPVILGDSSAVEVGNRVVAIGNALGQFQNTVTVGIISGYGRNVQAADATGVDSLQNLFQTDAAINRGNSGGPLVNVNGEVIGVNTAVAAGTAQNIGFAIPINDVKGLIESVLRKGRLERPYLGVRYISVTDDVAAEFELSVKRGAYIVSGSSSEPAVLPDSPAAKAGLQEGDVIIKVNDTPVDDNNSLTSLIGSRSVGDQVAITYVRDGQERTTETTIEAAPES